MTTCGWCKIYKADVKTWTARALEYWGMYAPLPHKIKALEEALESERQMNHILTKELEQLKNETPT